MGKADPLFIPAKDNRTVQLTRDLIALGEGTPELGFATNVGTAAKPLWRSGSGWVGNYFTTNSLGRVVRTAVPQSGLTREQNDLSNEAAGSFYRDALYQRYPKFAKAMPSEAMAVMGDVLHHGRQENTRSLAWDKDNRAVWAAGNNDKVAQAYLLGRGYSNKWDFNEVAARQILDYTRDSGTNRIYRRVIQRFNVLRDKLGKDKRPWDYFDPKADKAKKDALTTELKKAWAEVNKGERADEKGGKATNRWGGNLRSEDRPLYLFRDDKGKTTGYGTTESIVIPGVGDQAGQFVVAPTIVDGKKLTNEQAAAHYRESGEYWAARPTAEEADRTAQEVHEDHARIYGPQWNEYIEAHPDELSEKLKAEIEESKKAEVRQDAGGGDAREDEIMTENSGIVSSAGDADIPVSDGPRIVINPSTFRNKKDALCVAFNERFRIAMEQYGFEPKSEPTERQRRFFADTAYADDETMLRRTILARVLTLDTSVKDPTDEQMREALAFLGEFGRRERPSNDWEANAIRRLARLVESTLPKGDRK